MKEPYDVFNLLLRVLGIPEPETVESLQARVCGPGRLSFSIERQELARPQVCAYAMHVDGPVTVRRGNIFGQKVELYRDPFCREPYPNPAPRWYDGSVRFYCKVAESDLCYAPD